ncbi:MAG: thioredoxin [Treponema sp.]|nr:thioredoxin [Treponema sp.]
MAERLTKENFDSAVKSPEKVLVDFYSDSCVPCKKLNPVLGDLEDEHEKEIKVYKVNTNFDAELAEKYNVLSTPTLIFFKNGQEADRKSGFQTIDKLEDWLEL